MFSANATFPVLTTPTETQYLATALWTATDDHGEPLDSRFTVRDFHHDAMRDAVHTIAAFRELIVTRHGDTFLSDAMDAMGHDETQMAHDLWLTQNRHGSGFWDCGRWGQYGDALTNAAHTFRERDVYVGDDGKLHLF